MSFICTGLLADENGQQVTDSSGNTISITDAVVGLPQDFVNMLQTVPFVESDYHAGRSVPVRMTPRNMRSWELRTSGSKYYVKINRWRKTTASSRLWFVYGQLVATFTRAGSKQYLGHFATSSGTVKWLTSPAVYGFTSLVGSTLRRHLGTVFNGASGTTTWTPGGSTAASIVISSSGVNHFVTSEVSGDATNTITSNSVLSGATKPLVTDMTPDDRCVWGVSLDSSGTPYSPPSIWSLDDWSEDAATNSIPGAQFYAFYVDNETRSNGSIHLNGWIDWDGDVTSFPSFDENRLKTRLSAQMSDWGITSLKDKWVQLSIEDGYFDNPDTGTSYTGSGIAERYWRALAYWGSTNWSQSGGSTSDEKTTFLELQSQLVSLADAIRAEFGCFVSFYRLPTYPRWLKYTSVTDKGTTTNTPDPDGAATTLWSLAPQDARTTAKANYSSAVGPLVDAQDFLTCRFYVEDGRTNAERTADGDSQNPNFEQIDTVKDSIAYIAGSSQTDKPVIPILSFRSLGLSALNDNYFFNSGVTVAGHTMTLQGAADVVGSSPATTDFRVYFDGSPTAASTSEYTVSLDSNGIDVNLTRTGSMSSAGSLYVVWGGSSSYDDTTLYAGHLLSPTTWEEQVLDRIVDINSFCTSNGYPELTVLMLWTTGIGLWPMWTFDPATQFATWAGFSSSRRGYIVNWQVWKDLNYVTAGDPRAKNANSPDQHLFLTSSEEEASAFVAAGHNHARGTNTAHERYLDEYQQYIKTHYLETLQACLANNNTNAKIRWATFTGNLVSWAGLSIPPNWTTNGSFSGLHVPPSWMSGNPEITINASNKIQLDFTLGSAWILALLSYSVRANASGTLTIGGVSYDMELIPSSTSGTKMGFQTSAVTSYSNADIESGGNLSWNSLTPFTFDLLDFYPTDDAGNDRPANTKNNFLY